MYFLQKTYSFIFILFSNKMSKLPTHKWRFDFEIKELTIGMCSQGQFDEKLINQHKGRFRTGNGVD